MSIEVRLRRAAQCEYDEAVDWYEQRRAGLGGRFALALDDTIAAISVQPDRYPEAFQGTREAPVIGWPYCVYYQVCDDYLVIIAVYHTSRDPETWKRRT